MANMIMVSYDSDVCFQASFVASGNRTDISLDDPNFWDKWAKKADIDMEMVNGRVCTAPQIMQYTEQSIIRTLLGKICCISQRYNTWISISVAAFLYLCYRLGKPFAEIVFALHSLSTEQLGDRHPSCQKADEAVQCHQGWAGRALRGRQRQWWHQT